MGQSGPTRVRVVTFTHPSYSKYATLEFIRLDYSSEETETSYVLKKAKKKLAAVRAGDIVEVVWDYDIESPVFPIVDAKPITGTLEERVEKMENWLHNAWGYPIPERE